jgi:hypothetical protein
LVFYLFSPVKELLTVLSFEGAEGLLDAIQAILEGIGKVTLQAVFLERVDCLGKYITTNGT